MKSKVMDVNKKREYCEILGVPPGASEAVVKKAYHRLALDFHPDRPHNKGKVGVEQEFKKIVEAYEQLSNGNHTLNNLKKNFKSEDIHSSLEHFFFTTKSYGSSLNNLNFASRSCSDLSSIASSSPEKTKKPVKGHTLQTSLRITFNEAVLGCTKVLEYSRNTNCFVCGGSGTVSTSREIYCKDCGSSGSIRANLAGATVSTPCSTCSRDRESKSTCQGCKGLGKAPTRKKCSVHVPPGISTGMTQIFTGEGDIGSDGGDYGDFIVCFQVENHSDFKREGTDVIFPVSLSFPTLALGTVISVPTIYGSQLSVSVPPGSQHLDEIVIKGEGFPDPQNVSVKGNMRVQLHVFIPKDLQPLERKLLEQLSALPSFRTLHHSFK